MTVYFNVGLLGRTSRWINEKVPTLFLFNENYPFVRVLERARKNINIMRKVFLLLGVCCTLFLSSCSTLSRTTNVAKNANTDVLINPIGASLDLENAQKITGDAQAWYFLWFRVWGDKKYTETSQDMAASVFKGRSLKVRSAALYKALEGKEYDVVLSPRYDTKMKSILFGLVKRYQVKVNAYGSKISELKHRNPGEEDYDVMLYNRKR